MSDYKLVSLYPILLTCVIVADLPAFIRLGRYGAATPIGSQLDSAEVGGTTWEIWNGMNEDMEVYSFVASEPVTSFDADIKEFWDYLTDNHSYPADGQYLLSKLLYQFADSDRIKCSNRF